MRLASVSSSQHQPCILHALRETPRETMLNDQTVPKPQGVRLDVLINPFFASRSKRAEEEHCALIADENVGSIVDKLRRTAHSCVLLLNTHQRFRAKQSRQHRRRLFSVEIDRYEFPRHIEPLAGSRHLTISSQVAGSGNRPLSDAWWIIRATELPSMALKSS